MLSQLSMIGRVTLAAGVPLMTLRPNGRGFGDGQEAEVPAAGRYLYELVWQAWTL
jgi:hypothetical protein